MRRVVLIPSSNWKDCPVSLWAMEFLDAHADDLVVEQVEPGTARALELVGLIPRDYLRGRGTLYPILMTFDGEEFHSVAFSPNDREMTQIYNWAATQPEGVR